MYQITLYPNRDDQPRFVTLVSYARDGGRVTPVFREWRAGVDGTPSLTCTRIRIMKWRDVRRPDVPLTPTIQTTTRARLIASGILRPRSA